MGAVDRIPAAGDSHGGTGFSMQTNPQTEEKPMRLARRLTTGAATVIGALALLALPGAAAAKDGNHDRIPDRWEHRHHLSTSVSQAARDQDHDHLHNRAEFLAGDDPRDRDSDDDGVMDGDENAGTIQSFDTTTDRLVISLFGGDTVSGLVTDQTRLECEDHAPDASVRARHGEEEPDDDRGHEEEPGDDRGDSSGPGSSHSGRGPSGHDDHGDGANCTTSDLIEGTTVEEAELELEDGVATFEEVELAG